MGRKQPAEDVERQVRARHPHVRLADRAGYEGKDLPAWWFCALHDCRFRAKASSLISVNSGSCPDCIEARALEKRRRKRADPYLDRHLAQIREHIGEDFARTYRLHCEGVKWEDIGAEFGISIQGVQGRLRRITSVLRNLR